MTADKKSVDKMTVENNDCRHNVNQPDLTALE